MKGTGASKGRLAAEQRIGKASSAVFLRIVQYKILSVHILVTIDPLTHLRPPLSIVLLAYTLPNTVYNHNKP
jgi:hypothetical protein